MKSALPGPILGGLLAILILCGIGAFSLYAYVSNERQQALVEWQSRLDQIAAGKADQIGKWLDIQLEQAQELANNASLQLYLWQLTGSGAEIDPAVEPAQYTYLSALLQADANRKELSKNQNSGLALLDADLNRVVQTSNMPPRGLWDLRIARKALTTASVQIGDLQLNPPGHPILTLAVPVQPVSGGAGSSGAKPTGILITVIDVAPIWLSFLGRTGGSRSLLAIPQENSIRYLTPVDATNDRALTYSYERSVDDNETRFLSVHTKITGSPWQLVQQIDESQVLKELQKQSILLAVILLLAGLLATSLMIAIWRYRSGADDHDRVIELTCQIQSLQQELSRLRAGNDSVNADFLSGQEIRVRDFVGTLDKVVDLHDPYSNQHSARMTEVVDTIGHELNLSQEEKRTLKLAALLGNLGKLMIPGQLLSKTGLLDDSERTLIRQHVQLGLGLLTDLKLDSLVLETIAQKQERLDGSGYPKGLDGEQLLLTGKILALANAFVALVSDRAYRDALPLQEALSQLSQEADTKYERRVVTALFAAVEHRKEWRQWNH